MRTIPTSIRIGGHTINVVREGRLMSKSGAYGMFDGADLEIAIDASLEDSLAWETFWHEVIEALNFFAEAEMEHKTIQVFGLLLHQVADSVLEAQQSEGHVPRITEVQDAEKQKTPSQKAAKRTPKGRVQG